MQESAQSAGAADAAGPAQLTGKASESHTIPNEGAMRSRRVTEEELADHIGQNPEGSYLYALEQPQRQRAEAENVHHV